MSELSPEMEALGWHRCWGLMEGGKGKIIGPGCRDLKYCRCKSPDLVAIRKQYVASLKQRRARARRGRPMNAQERHELALRREDLRRRKRAQREFRPGMMSRVHQEGYDAGKAGLPRKSGYAAKLLRDEWGRGWDEGKGVV